MLQLDIQAVYEQGGEAQVTQLQRALEDPQGAAPADAEALRRMLGRIVWTPSMRRMYTLLSRWASHCCSACEPSNKGPVWWQFVCNAQVCGECWAANLEQTACRDSRMCGECRAANLKGGAGQPS